MSNQVKVELENWRGYSAYEVAVKNGFNGTEKEWLEHLNGGITVTVNNKVSGTDGNIEVLASDILLVEEGQITVKKKLDDLQAEKFDSAKIVNNLTTEDEGYVLDARQGEKLKAAIDNLTHALKAKLLQNGWSDTEPYMQTLEAPGVLESDEPIIDVDTSGATTMDEMESLNEAWSMILGATASENTVIVAFSDVPDIDIPIKIKVVR